MHGLFFFDNWFTQITSSQLYISLRQNNITLCVSWFLICRAKAYFKNKETSYVKKDSARMICIFYYHCFAACLSGSVKIILLNREIKSSSATKCYVFFFNFLFLLKQNCFTLLSFSIFTYHFCFVFLLFVFICSAIIVIVKSLQCP